MSNKYCVIEYTANDIFLGAEVLESSAKKIAMQDADELPHIFDSKFVVYAVDGETEEGLYEDENDLPLEVDDV